MSDVRWVITFTGSRPSLVMPEGAAVEHHRSGLLRVQYTQNGELVTELFAQGYWLSATGKENT